MTQTCCDRRMRQAQTVGLVRLLVCDACRHRAWYVGDREVSDYLAAKILRLDELSEGEDGD